MTRVFTINFSSLYKVGDAANRKREIEGILSLLQQDLQLSTQQFSEKETVDLTFIADNPQYLYLWFTFGVGGGNPDVTRLPVNDDTPPEDIIHALEQKGITVLDGETVVKFWTITRQIQTAHANDIERDRQGPPGTEP